MTTPPPQPCAYCPHELNIHTVYLLDDRGLGMTLCPVTHCGCGATLRISTNGPSTPQEIEDTRAAVRQIITDAGLPLPRFLQ